MAVSLKTVVFWILAQCGLVEVYRLPETSVNFCQTTCRSNAGSIYFLQDSYLLDQDDIRLLWNQKFHSYVHVSLSGCTAV
jgi:hypothetical protein